jgi:tRNA A-37 threonylcarbamoyl transferase component Bud32
MQDCRKQHQLDILQQCCIILSRVCAKCIKRVDQHGICVTVLVTVNTSVSKAKVASSFRLGAVDDKQYCVQVIIQIAKKLQVMHKAGFCHRDLKPGNCIWLPSQNAWSLIDFGCTAACGACCDQLW